MPSTHNAGRIAVAMSGGIDSSVVAALLAEAGSEVVGIHAILFDSRDCSDEYDVTAAGVRSAEAVAARYGFPFRVVDLRKEFRDLIILPFCRAYAEGLTPNPCTHCNALIKAGILLETAKRFGCERLATGHYAEIRTSPEGRYYVCRGKEIGKDQSYFLYRLSQDQLRQLVFPLSRYRKDEVRMTAASRGIATSRSESQDVCFIADGTYPAFIERETGIRPNPGDIVDRSGNLLGRHKGIHHYTVGQRRGLGISSSSPLYVTGIDAARNVIIAGTADDLKSEALIAGDIHYMKETSLAGRQVLVKARSTQQPFFALLEEDPIGLRVVFESPQIGISPGQAAVFYNENMEILGGGTIHRGIPCGGG